VNVRYHLDNTGGVNQNTQTLINLTKNTVYRLCGVV
jgi:hypothetical protein